MRHERGDADAGLAERDRRRLHHILGRLEAKLAADQVDRLDSLGEKHRSRARRIRDAQPVIAARAREQLVQAPLVDDPALADDRHAVTELLDLGEDVAREKDRDPLAREPLHELAHVAHAGGVEPGGGLVE